MGTDAWRNWQAFDAGSEELENFDDELQSDVSFFGGPIALGPYKFSTVIRDPGPVGPCVILQGGIHAKLIPDVVVDGQLAKADSSAYHGGTIGDEIAALLSLEFGVRIRLAGTSRLSGLHDGGEIRPPIYFEVPRLARPGPPSRELMPLAMRRKANLDATSRLESFPAIDETAQVELVRAARSYATALWWANEDPNQAWLQLVTAVETAAKCRQILTTESVDLLRELWPEVWEVIKSAADDAKVRIADLLAPQIRATRTFIDFVDECAPDPPSVRSSFAELDWNKMRQHARVIYGHRSQALHAGKPFPMPMLEQPRTEESGAVQETPLGLNAGGLGGVWDATETPMLLSIFEYIARGALLQWWDELASRRRAESPAGAH